MSTNIIHVEFPKPLSRDVFKVMLTCAPNRQAEKILAIIRSALGSPIDLEAVCSRAPFYDAIVSRDPRHPRSGAVLSHLLDHAYDEGKIPMTVEHRADCTVATIGEKPPEPDWKRRVALFGWMARHDFRGGSNGWRGDLLKAVMNGACYHPTDPIAFAYAEALIASGRVQIEKWAARNYPWVGSLAKLAVVERLGLRLDAPGLLEQALRYLGCSTGNGETEEGRGQVVIRLLDSGARIEPEPLSRLLQCTDSTSLHGRDYATKYGLIDRLKGAATKVATAHAPRAAA